MDEFEKIYLTYFQDVYRYLRGVTSDAALAEELTEETFFKAMHALNKFEGRCDIRVWLCQIGKNLYLNHLKKQKKLAEPKVADQQAPVERELEMQLLDKDAAREIHRLLHQLKEPYKEVFSLRVFGELSFKQIGELFGKSDHWACVVYHRAKSKIQEGMEELT